MIFFRAVPSRSHINTPSKSATTERIVAKEQSSFAPTRLADGPSVADSGTFKNSQLLPRRMNEKLTVAWIKVRSFLRECLRILQITKKPTRDEYKVIVKVTGIGILIIGLLGFGIVISGTLAGI